MFRLATQRVAGLMRGVVCPRPMLPGAKMMSSGPKESDEEFDARYVAYFSRPNIDAWELRKGINELAGMDLVPDPKIIISVLHACRRLNDYAVTTRYLETIKYRSKVNKEIYPYIMKEIKPTLDELGISTLEELGYDKPELALKSVYDY